MEEKITCVSESPASLITCVAEIMRVTINYLNGNYKMISFSELVNQDYAYYMTLSDVIVMTLFFIFFYVIHAIFHFIIPNILSSVCPTIPAKIMTKISENTITIFTKLIIVSWCCYVIFVQRECNMTIMFSVIWISKYRSLASHMLHLFCMSNYFFKLFAVFFLDSDVTKRNLSIFHHVVTLVLLLISATHK